MLLFVAGGWSTFAGLASPIARQRIGWLLIDFEYFDW
jgi:hypothetical protein